MFFFNFIITLNSSFSSKKRTRGPTRNLDLLSMKPEKKRKKKLHDSISKDKLFMIEKGKVVKLYGGIGAIST